MAEKLSFTAPSANIPATPPIGAKLGEAVVDISLNVIHEFPEHPFLVKVDAAMDELVQSIRDHGVQEPVTLRPMGEYYQILSGHRRCKAARLAGLACVPAIVKPMTDDEAVICMVDANLHRPYILPSEKARSYKMKMDALRHQGKKTDSSVQNGDVSETWSANQIAVDAGESSRQVYRYIRLSNLINRFLEMIDNKEKKVKPNPRDMVFVMPMNVGLTLATLTEEQQYLLFDCICETGKVPSLSQAMDLYEGAKADTFTTEFISSVLDEKEKKAEIPPFEQSFIDDKLLSWHSEFLEKCYKTKPKSEFVKIVTREYRNRGSFYNGIGIDGQSDGLHIRAQNKEMRLTWTQVANRIGELIAQGKYVSPYKKAVNDTTTAEETSVLCDTVAQSESPSAGALRPLRNKQEREDFLAHFENWGVWKEIPELRVRFYKYDLPNGARIVAQTYVHPSIKYLSYSQEEHTVAEYALLLPPDDDYRGKYGQEYTFYRPNGASKSTIIDYLTEKKPMVLQYAD